MGKKKKTTGSAPLPIPFTRAHSDRVKESVKEARKNAKREQALIERGCDCDGISIF